MRIDASNLLLAAQAQAQRPATGKAPPSQATFETLDFAKPSEGEDHKQAAPSGVISRPGMRLDIKV